MAQPARPTTESTWLSGMLNRSEPVLFASNDGLFAWLYVSCTARKDRAAIVADSIVYVRPLQPSNKPCAQVRRPALEPVSSV